MEGRVPRARGSKQTAHGTKKLHDFHERNTTRARKQKNEQRERQSIHSKSLPLSSLISAASSLCQPSPPQQQEGGIRSAVPVPFRPLFSRGKTLLQVFAASFFLGKFSWFLGESLDFSGGRVGRSSPNFRDDSTRAIRMWASWRKRRGWSVTARLLVARIWAGSFGFVSRSDAKSSAISCRLDSLLSYLNLLASKILKRVKLWLFNIQGHGVLDIGRAWAESKHALCSIQRHWGTKTNEK